jgi:DNA invertase Pin-like site-specific DNA recombinase
LRRIPFDGSITDPTLKAVRDALIAFMSATAQAQAEATREAQRAGIQHAMDKGDRYLGRKPSYSRDQFDAVRNMLAQDNGISLIAKSTGLSRQAIYRIRDNPVEAEASLAAWGL